MMKTGKYKYLLSILVILTIIYFIVMAALLCLTPPVARDALIHHLAIPKLWIHHGGFYEMPWAPHSYFPMNVDLLYGLSLYFGNDIIPAFIHLCFALGTAAMIYLYLRSRLNHIAGLLGFLMFFSTPIVSKLSTMAYVDLGLVFFITACMLSLMHWRASDYKSFPWLMLASVAMGLALGTKYNALIAWFFLTMATVFIYSRDTGNSGKSLKYGFIFFVISLAVFSPWMIKNTLLTGNPLYPLFPGIFKSTEGGGGTNTVAFGYTHIGIFKMRELLYGENLWDVLLIPFRMFFQGQDDSPRYFDGVLNPLLILFIPFAFLKREKKGENMLFLLFSVFFILLTLFLDQIRIRYILPAIPFFVILSVTGLINLLEWITAGKNLWRKICAVALAAVFAGLIFLNIIYFQKYFRKIAPVEYIVKKESRNDFISRHDASYPAIMYINKNTDETSRIRLVLLSGRGYYLDRIFRDDPSRGIAVIQGMVNHAADSYSFYKYLKSLDCTHLFVRYDLFRQYLLDNYDSTKVEQLTRQMNRTLKKVFEDRNYVVFSIMNQ